MVSDKQIDDHFVCAAIKMLGKKNVNAILAEWRAKGVIDGERTKKIRKSLFSRKMIHGSLKADIELKVTQNLLWDGDS